MSKSLVAAAAMAAFLGVSGTAALAQTPSRRAAAANKGGDSIALRIQQSALGAEDCESASLHLSMASDAAAAGNEGECWRQRRISGLFGATPVFPRRNPTDVAAASLPSGSGGSH